MGGVALSYVLNFLADLGIATGFAANFISMLQGVTGILDTIFVLMIGTISAGMIIRSFQTKIHPIFGLVGLFTLPLLIYSVAATSNMFSLVANIPILSAAANQYQYSAQVFNNSAKIATVIGSIALLVMVGGGYYARQR